MPSLAIASFFCGLPSLLLTLVIERRAIRLGGALLPLWRRILIPLPIVCFLAANLDSVLSLLSYLNTHPKEILAIRYDGHEAWSTERFFYAGLFSAGLLPFVIASTPLNGFRLLPVVWMGHALWLVFPFTPLLLATGVPLQQ